MGLIQRAFDFAGLTTISLTLAPSITILIKPSRSLFIAHPFGLTMGDVHDRDRQAAVVSAMLAAAERPLPAGTIESLPFEWTKDDLRSRQLRKDAH